MPSPQSAWLSPSASSAPAPTATRAPLATSPPPARQQEIGPALGEENDLTKDADAQQQLVKGAECLRGLGYDVPDPEPGKGLNVKDVPQDALQKCFNNQGAQTK